MGHSRSLANGYASIAVTLGILFTTKTMGVFGNLVGFNTTSLIFAGAFFFCGALLLILIRDPEQIKKAMELKNP